MAARLVAPALLAAAAAGAPDACAAEGAACRRLAGAPVLLQTARGRGRVAALAAAGEGNVYEHVAGVGAWGGYCTCPDGQRYNVGDQNDGCRSGPASLACFGGAPGACEKASDPARAGMRVTCAAAAVAAPSISEPQEVIVQNVYETVSGVGAWGGWCTCPDGQRYNVGDKMDACALGPASLACYGGTPGECEKVVVGERNGKRVICAPATTLAPPAYEENVYKTVSGVGGWGGWCTCPDGQRYNVGDKMDGCALGPASLACYGGTPGACEKVVVAERNGKQVTCGQAVGAAPSPGEPVSPTTTTAITAAPVATPAPEVSAVGATTSSTTPPPPCEAPGGWPHVAASCEAPCEAAVATEPYGGRCDTYCESFGHVCMAAAAGSECGAGTDAACESPFVGAAEMLCTCHRDTSDDEVWRPSSVRVGSGWCETPKPADDWSLFRTCGSEIPVRVLSYNLFWWNLFGVRGGNDRSAGRLIESTGPFDLMGFQECDSVWRVISDAYITETHTGLQGPRGLAVAYAKDMWTVVSQGSRDAGEDRPEQYYGRRSVQWVRFQHKASGKHVLFLNHHGPLPVNTGGVCGGEATGSHLLRAASENSKAGDLRIFVGDVNADANSATQQLMLRHMFRAKFDWVDAIFASCPAEAGRVLGTGGSDHNAISASFRM